MSPPQDPASYYTATANQRIDSQPLAGAQRCDICVIGGGYTGLSSALRLAERGYRVILLEAERIAWGASGRNGGHVSVGQRMDQMQLEALVGTAVAQRLWQFGLDAVAEVRSLIHEHAIHCDLQDGDLHLAAKRAHAQGFARYVDHLARHYAYEHAAYVDTDHVRDYTSAQGFHGGLLDTRSCHLHPLNFALGLAAAAQRAGAILYENSRALAFSETGNTVQVTTAAGRVHCDTLILGCNGYLGRLAPKAARRIMPINNFMVATEPLTEAQARRISSTGCALSDSRFVISYWRVAGDRRLLFGGGETYTRRFPKDIAGFVRPYVLRAYPELTATRIDYGWGGTLAITRNRLPAFGRLSSRIYYAQGYSGHGVPTATFAGRLLAEAIAGTAERFDVMATLPVPAFPGGTLLRWPGLFLGMLYYSLRDRLG